jgi:hypothetical protein
MEPEQRGIDSVLQTSLAGPAPRLSADFEKRLMREVNRNSPRRAWYSRALMAGYGVVSVITCATVMRSQGLDWATIAGATLLPLPLVALGSWMRRMARAHNRAGER